SGVVAKTLSREYKGKRQVVVKAMGNGTIRLRTLAQPRIERDYAGTINVSREGDHLMLVNDVPLEDYVAGVVQSEAGKDKGIEYYKLQAVSCRTYALANQRRHLAEGFELCDGTHCQ